MSRNLSCLSCCARFFVVRATAFIRRKDALSGPFSLVELEAKSHSTGGSAGLSSKGFAGIFVAGGGAAGLCWRAVSAGRRIRQKRMKLLREQDGAGRCPNRQSEGVGASGRPSRFDGGRL